MQSTAVLQAEAARYGTLAQDLKASFVGIDDETLTDTLEGLSQLPDLLHALVRSSLLDEAFAAGLKGRLAEMKERLDRLLERSGRKRELVLSSMLRAGLAKLIADDFSISVRQGPPRLDILDEGKIADLFLIPQPAKVDRAGLLAALKRGEVIEGAALLDGQPHLQVRTK